MVYQRARQVRLTLGSLSQQRDPCVQRTKVLMTCSPTSLTDTISAEEEYRGSCGVLSSGTHPITKGSPGCYALRAVNSAGLYNLLAAVLTTGTSAVVDVRLAGLHAPVVLGSGCSLTGSHTSQGRHGLSGEEEY